MDQKVRGSRQRLYGTRCKVHPVLLLLLLLRIVRSRGCATTKKLYSKMSPDSSGLKSASLFSPSGIRPGWRRKAGATGNAVFVPPQQDGVFVIETVKRSSAAADSVRLLSSAL